MSKYVINDTTLTSIGDAIREKGGTTELIPVSGLANAIINLPSGDGELPEEAFTITGDCRYRFANNGWNWFIDLYGNRINTENIKYMEYMFSQSTDIEEIPFELNKSDSFIGEYANMFAGCEKLKHIPDIVCNDVNHRSYSGIFIGCSKLENIPYLIGAYPNKMDDMFSRCNSLRELPIDYFDTWNFDRIKTYTSSDMSGIFSSCYSLRKVPSKILEIANEHKATSAYYTYYYGAFTSCYVLDEIVGLPVVEGINITSNMFNATFSATYRVKRLLFKTKDDGTVKTANWKNQTIDLSNQVGYKAATASFPLDQHTQETLKNVSQNFIAYNSGITIDKAIYTDETYNLLKDDPDAYCLANDSSRYSDYSYSRYNHDSAVETIN